MPTSSLMQNPKSRSAEEFESVCTDILTNIYTTTFTLYGRSGQKQKGINIYAEIEKGKYIVEQCKNYFLSNSADNLFKQIEKDVKAAEQSKFRIFKFIAMTSMDRDKNVQDAIINIDSIFDIEVWFCKDIQKNICNDTSLLYKYYPQFSTNSQLTISTLNDIILNLNALKSIAPKFNYDYKDYRVACNQKNDTEVYNQCVSMFNAAFQISTLKNQWYLQIQKLGILDIIEDVLKSIPNFYDASIDWTGQLCATL